MGRLRDFSAKCWTLPALNFCNCSQRLKQTKLCINEDAQKGNICFEIETNPWSRDAISIVRQENPVEGGVRLPEPGVLIKLNCKGFMCAGAIADPGWIQSGSRPWKYNLRWHFESEKKAIQIPNSKWQLTRYSQPLLLQICSSWTWISEPPSVGFLLWRLCCWWNILYLFVWDNFYSDDLLHIK